MRVRKFSVRIIDLKKRKKKNNRMFQVATHLVKVRSHLEVSRKYIPIFLNNVQTLMYEYQFWNFSCINNCINCLLSQSIQKLSNWRTI